MSENPNAGKEGAIAEYTQVCENFRHYSTLRFGILTVFIGLLVVLAGAILVEGIAVKSAMLVLVKSTGILVTFVFWRYQETAMRHLAHYGNRAKEIERSLGFENLSTRPTPKKWYLRMDSATRLLYGAIALFWLVTFLI